MYGLGIRLGFYMQWLAGTLAGVLEVESDVVFIRSGIFGFSIAMFVAVVVQIATSTNNTLDIYIPLLLSFGFFYYLLPIHIWTIYRSIRTTSRSKRMTSHFRRTTVVASTEFDILQQSLLLAVSGLKLWFWTTKVLESNRPGCREYGFLFRRLELNADPMRIVNICLDCGMILVLVHQLVSTIIRAAMRRWPRETCQPPSEREHIVVAQETLMGDYTDR